MRTTQGTTPDPPRSAPVPHGPNSPTPWERMKGSKGHRWLIGLIITMVVTIAGIGFVGSYLAVKDLAVEHGFGDFAYVFPVGIDAGIVALLAFDLLLTWLRMPFAPLRYTAWLLTAGTIVFNAAVSIPTDRPVTGWDLLGASMHGIIPVLFVVTIEAARHAIGRMAAITADKHMEGVRLIRWILAPLPTFRLWRRMKLWELRSYDQAVMAEQARLVYRSLLRQTYGKKWRKKAPLGALTPLQMAAYGVPLWHTGPAALERLEIEGAELLRPAALRALPIGGAETRELEAPADLPSVEDAEAVDAELETFWEEAEHEFTHPDPVVPAPQTPAPAPEAAAGRYMDAEQLYAAYCGFVTEHGSHPEGGRKFGIYLMERYGYAMEQGGPFTDALAEPMRVLRERYDRQAAELAASRPEPEPVVPAPATPVSARRPAPPRVQASVEQAVPRQSANGGSTRERVEERWKLLTDEEKTQSDRHLAEAWAKELGSSWETLRRHIGKVRAADQQGQLPSQSLARSTATEETSHGVS